MQDSPLQNANKVWGSATILGQDGNPLPRASRLDVPPANQSLATPPPGGGGDPNIEIAGLKQNVRFLNWAMATMFIVGLSAIVSSYLALAADLRQVGLSAAAQNATLSALEKSLDRIEGKLDDDKRDPVDREK